MPSLDTGRVSLRELGAFVGVEIELGVEDRREFERLLDVPIRLLAREFRNPSAFRRYVLSKLAQAEDRERVRRIGKIFKEPR